MTNYNKSISLFFFKSIFIMEHKDTKQLTDENPDDFIKFLFGSKVQDKNTIKLELGIPDKDKHIGLHIFEQLIQIFMDGLKYLYGDDGKVNVQDLTKDNIKLMKQYYLSIGYKLIFEIFDRTNYIAKPNMFMEHTLIKDNTMLDEFYYELLSETVEHKIPIMYRVSFKFIQ